MENKDRIFVSFEDKNTIDDRIKQGDLFIDYYEDWKKSQKKGIIVPENYNKIFYLSPITESSIYTKDLKNCFSLVVRGVDDKNKYKALLTHQNPVFLESYGANSYFDKKLTEQLEKIKNDSEILDVFVVGGNYAFSNVNNFDKSFASFYKEHLEILNEIINRNLKRDIEILTGPNFSPNPQSFYLETQTAKAYLYGLDNNNGFNYPYKIKDLEKEEKKWIENLKAKNG